MTTNVIQRDTNICIPSLLGVALQFYSILQTYWRCVETVLVLHLEAEHTKDYWVVRKLW